MSKGVHNIAFYVSPDPECSRTTQNSEISLAPSRGRILYAIYGNSTCIINHIVVTAIDKRYRNYYVSTQCHPGKKHKWNTEMLVEMLDTGKGVEVMVPMDPKLPFIKTTLEHEDSDLTPAWVNFNGYWLCDELEGREKKRLRVIWKRDLV